MNVQAPGPQSQPALPEIRDIAPPVDVFPWPMWMIIAAGVIVLILIGGSIWLTVVYLRRTPPPLPPSPRTLAKRALEELRASVNHLDPYEFSVRVSDVLRSFIAAHYGLRVTKQTSPEFLASIANAKEFTNADVELLAKFLEHADLIKFARIDATSMDSAELLERAFAFVQGAQG